MRGAWLDGTSVKKCVTSKNVPVGHVLKSWHFLCNSCSCLKMCFFSSPLLAFRHDDFSELTLFESQRDKCCSQILHKQKERSAWGQLFTYQDRFASFILRQAKVHLPPFTLSPILISLQSQSVQDLPDRGGFYANVWTNKCGHVAFPLSQKYTLQKEH